MDEPYSVKLASCTAAVEIVQWLSLSFVVKNGGCKSGGGIGAGIEASSGLHFYSPSPSWIHKSFVAYVHSTSKSLKCQNVQFVYRNVNKEKANEDHYCHLLHLLALL